MLQEFLYALGDRLVTVFFLLFTLFHNSLFYYNFVKLLFKRDSAYESAVTAFAEKLGRKALVVAFPFRHSSCQFSAAVAFEFHLTFVNFIAV